MHFTPGLEVVKETWKSGPAAGQSGAAGANKGWEADLPGEAAGQIQEAGSIRTQPEVVGHQGKLVKTPLAKELW